MTTTSFDHVDSATQFGSDPNQWQDVTTLSSSTSGNAYVESNGTFTGMRTLQLQIPDFMPDIPAGSEFVSMVIKFRAYVNTLQATDYFRFLTRQSGSTKRSDDVDSTSTSLQTFSGDKSYWGFTGDARDIINHLADGTIKWWFETKGVAGVATRRDVADFQVQLVYAEPDTKASLLPLIP